jgi:SAM-dependent methyltransferase
MEYTGERMVPEASEVGTYMEHVFRYAFACKMVKNLEVLDIASGEGYGTWALSKVAKNAIGVDVSAEAVGHAKGKYELDFRVGHAEQIPLESASRNAVVSFETIEHVAEPKQFIQEISRVLRPGGVLIMSTPNKDVYHQGMAPNPFHCSELSKTEFLRLLDPFFEVRQVLGQVFPHCALDNLQRLMGMVSDRLAFYLRRKIEGGLTKRFLPLSAGSDETERNRMIEAIPTLSVPFDRFWNPFGLRKLSRSETNQPTYFVIVAMRRTAMK